jgi:3-methyladenine DNA glycosylase/8-oxoguanine DNA glycosylase
MTTPARTLAEAPDAHRTHSLPAMIDLRLTLAPIAHGSGDPTIRLRDDGIWMAFRTPAGPATLHLRGAGTELAASAWGPGAELAVAASATLVGAGDDPSPLRPQHAVIADLVRRNPGLRLPRTDRPWEALLPAICEQKVTGFEARLAYRGIVRAHGERAPGPGGLWLAPAPSVLAGLPYFAFHRFGLERRRADVIRRAAAEMSRVLEADHPRARTLLSALPGIGPWTLAEVERVAWGDPDAVSIGDFHMPNLVAWALAREPRADDARMLTLLEPYRGQRGRVQRLLEISGLRPPRYGPRMPPRRIQDQ